MTDGLNERTPRPLGQAMSLGGDRDALAEYYGAWAPTYDADVGDESTYGLPASVLFTLDAATAHESWLADRSIRVLDAGCGTGRVGEVLAAQGYSTIDGIDLSVEMVDLARARGVYRTLEAGIDLTVDPPAEWAAKADLVVIGGVFTVGHLRPQALHSVAKLVRSGGVLIATVRPGYYDTTDFAGVHESFVSSDAADLLAEFEALPYTADTTGRYYAYRIN